jgi:hypothetical protein
VWDVLEEVITEHPVLLNRAPTLHRLGIQAFEPQLIEGKAIQLHPLVCTAFNADFDGDQMAVHLPLSAEAQAEARVLMLSSNNILKPADGRPVTLPTRTRRRTWSRRDLLPDRGPPGWGCWTRGRPVQRGAARRTSSWARSSWADRQRARQGHRGRAPQELIQIWTDATAELTEAMEANFTEDNPIFMMVNSGARGNMTQMRQIAAMRGLVANPKGEIIARPIKSNFREGLSVLEYFISTHGGRKGQADTALRTADSGYLTRRLVDVSQDVIIREEDCGTERGLTKVIAPAAPRDGKRAIPSAVSRTSRPRSTPGRWPPTSPTPRAGAGPGRVDLGDELIKIALSRRRHRGQGPLRADLRVGTGTCAMCYGRSLASGKLVDVGEAVGIVAAQSIGEPGTQLTMRTFHTGGVAGDDITRVCRVWSSSSRPAQPKGKAPIAEAAGRVRIEDGDRPQAGHRPRRRRARTWSTAAASRPPGVGGPARVVRTRSPTATTSRPASSSTPARSTRRTSCVSAACARCRSTWSTRCRPCTGRRALRSTTSTSRSSSGRCCAA